MHILFFTDNFPPEVNAPASRTYEHAKEWVKHGHNVTVLTCVPNFPRGLVYEGYTNKLWQKETIDGIRVIRLWTYIAANEGFFKRLLDFLSFMLVSFFASFFIRRVDLVIGTSPQFFTIVSAWMTSVFKMSPFIFELRDLWPESVRAVSAVKYSWLIDLFEKLELFMYRRADAIISVTNSFKQNLVSRGIENEKIHVVTNGVDTSLFAARSKDLNLIEKLGLHDKFVVGYIGTHGLAHGLSSVLEAAKFIQLDKVKRGIHFVFLGDGAEKEKLKNLSSKLDLQNVTFLDSVERDEVTRYWSVLDLSIVHLRKAELFKTVIPSKIFECMCMGIPILHAVEGESADIIVKTGAGVLVEPGNSYEIAAQIKALSEDCEFLSNMAEKSKASAMQFDRTQLATKMMNILERVYNSRS